ncbi:sirohydrochlorin chelatase [Paenibacillus sp. GD4]|uniref:sirohydrochlorin chelatase n=1 Tax=Paenibacillus sp. GD4 TaxID=3068890 RepID=UPI0027969044|nr:sirohydrochlorin chelatase [Paenibacillus sp. GD4]MDQ1910253.1 sirohydrochlorin chelatase [Paenibacillus sp. GD4]
MNAVLFVGHGSRDSEGNDEVRAFVESIGERTGQPIVETCFLEFEPPTVGAGIERCVERGATHIVVIPIMLFSAGHAKLHIPAMIDEAKRHYPSVRFTYARPVGVHEQVLEILASRLEAAGMHVRQEAEDTAILLVGRGSSDADANSDLYKISRLLWERMRVKWVEPAFIGVTSPLVEEGVERCLRLGAKRVMILPYFLFTGVLIKRMEGLAQEYAALHPGVRFELAEYFGFHPLLRSILLERVQEALLGEVKMSCDMCVYRIEAAKHHGHHHHDHDHDHHHHDHSHDHHHHDHDDSHEHAHGRISGKEEVS